MRTLLLAGFEMPQWGAAATCQAQLAQWLRRDGWDVASVDLVGQTALSKLLEDLAPDLALGLGDVAAALLAHAAPHLPLVFMTSGMSALTHLIDEGAVKDFMDFERQSRRGVQFTPPRTRYERQAVRAAQLIIVESPSVRYALENLLPRSARKVYMNAIAAADLLYAQAEAFAHLRCPFAERDIDVMFVAEDWTHPGKNYRLVEKIASRCEGLRVDVVGALDRPQRGMHHHGLVTRRDTLYGLLGRAKALVCPSLFDAAPWAMFEASAMGCNVVASPNCGSWELCHEMLRVSRCTPSAFLTAIQSAVTRPFADNRARFFGGYTDLAETLSVL